MNGIKFWLVFSIGVAAGATVALIYAPAEGAETRRKLKQSFDDASDYVKDASSQLGDQAQDLINRGKTAVGSAVDSGKSAVSSAVDSGKSAVNSAVDSGKSAVSSAADAVTSAVESHSQSTGAGAGKKVSEYV